MSNLIIKNKKLKPFKTSITVSGDKSISIRWVLFSSLASGVSNAHNLLLSEDVIAAINTIKKLGIKAKVKKNICTIYGKGIDGYSYKNLTLDAKNSGTLGRLILGLIINTNKKIKLIGDKSLSKRDFKRIAEPLKKFGANIILHKNKTLPLVINNSKKLTPIKYFETRGSAQCKSSVIFAGMRAPGTTIIKAKKSRNHTELLCKYLKLPITIQNRKKYDLIKIKTVKKIKPLNYNIPSDISSSSFFIALTVLTNNSKLIIKKVNINKSRIGIVTILRKMGVKIIFLNKKNYKGEEIGDIEIISPKKIKSINCPTSLNSGAIDEFLVIFLVAAKANGTSYFKNLSELNQKESPRLKIGSKILNMMGIKTLTTNSSIKIYGNPGLKINKKIIIKNYLKDHRIFMTSVVAALSFGGEWRIHDKESVETSFPSFMKTLKKIVQIK